MSPSTSFKFRVVTYQSSGWVALAVDFDVFGYGATEATALAQLRDQLRPLVSDEDRDAKQRQAPEQWKDLGKPRDLEVFVAVDRSLPTRNPSHGCLPQISGAPH